MPAAFRNSPSVAPGCKTGTTGTPGKICAVSFSSGPKTAGVNGGGGESAVRHGEENAEDGGLGQSADPGLGSGDPPCPVARQGGVRGGGADLAAAVRFRDRDPWYRPGQEPGQPAVADRRLGVRRDESSVAEAGGVTEVHVVVAADELKQHLHGRRAPASAVAGGNGEGQMPGPGQCAPDS